MLKRSLLIFSVLICILFALNAHAQIQNADVSFNVFPKYPKQNEEVRASVSTYSTDLNTARISWILNGKLELEGIGKKNFSFLMENPDFGMALEVKIETTDGSVVNKKISILSSDVDMLWEAYDTYSPPFYKGKTLAPVEGVIKVVAFPNTQSFTGYNYKWKLDGKSDLTSSGYEKNYFIYNNLFLEDKNTVEASVSDLLGNDVGEGSITIIPGNPKLIFYKKDPNIGIGWETALENGFLINRDGETIIAEPYFFYPNNLDSNNISFNWLLNGEKTEVKNPINSLSVKLVTEDSGTAIIKVIINNTKSLFMGVEKQLNVSF